MTYPREAGRGNRGRDEKKHRLKTLLTQRAAPILCYVWLKEMSGKEKKEDNYWWGHVHPNPSDVTPVAQCASCS